MAAFYLPYHRASLSKPSRLTTRHTVLHQARKLRKPQGPKHIPERSVLLWLMTVHCVFPLAMLIPSSCVQLTVATLSMCTPCEHQVLSLSASFSVHQTLHHDISSFGVGDILLSYVHNTAYNDASWTNVTEQKHNHLRYHHCIPSP